MLIALSDKHIATLSPKKIRIWNIETRQYEATLEVSARATTMLALSHKKLAVGYDDGSIRIWNISTGQCEGVLLGNFSKSTKITALALLHDGRLASSNDKYSNNKIHLWDLSTGQCVSTLSNNRDGGVSGLALLSDGRLASSSPCSWGVFLWDISTGQCLPFVPKQNLDALTSTIHGLTALPNGQFIAHHPLIDTVWDTASKNVEGLPFLYFPEKSLKYRVDGQTNYVNIRSMHTVSHDKLASRTVVSKDGKIVRMGLNYDGLEIWENKAGLLGNKSYQRVANYPELTHNIQYLAILPNDKVVKQDYKNSIIPILKYSHHAALPSPILLHTMPEDLIEKNLKSHCFDIADKLWNQEETCISEIPVQERVFAQLQQHKEYLMLLEIISKKFPSTVHEISPETLGNKNQLNQLKAQAYNHLDKTNTRYHMGLFKNELIKSLKKKLPANKKNLLDEIINTVQQELAKSQSALLSDPLKYIRDASTLLTTHDCKASQNRLNTWHKETYLEVERLPSPFILAKAAAAIASIYQSGIKSQQISGISALIFSEVHHLKTYENYLEYFVDAANYEKTKDFYFNFLQNRVIFEPYFNRTQWNDIAKKELVAALITTHSISRTFNSLDAIAMVLMPQALLDIKKNFTALSQKSDSAYLTQQIVYREMLQYIKDYFFSDTTFFDAFFEQLSHSVQNDLKINYITYLSKIFEQPILARQIEQCKEALKMEIAALMMYQPMYKIVWNESVSPEDASRDTVLWTQLTVLIKENLILPLILSLSDTSFSSQTAENLIQNEIVKTKRIIKEGKASQNYRESEEKAQAVLEFMADAPFAQIKNPAQKYPAKSCRELPFTIPSMAAMQKQRNDFNHLSSDEKKRLFDEGTALAFGEKNKRDPEHRYSVINDHGKPYIFMKGSLYYRDGRNRLDDHGLLIRGKLAFDEEGNEYFVKSIVVDNDNVELLEKTRKEVEHEMSMTFQYGQTNTQNILERTNGTSTTFYLIQKNVGQDAYSFLQDNVLSALEVMDVSTQLMQRVLDIYEKGHVHRDIKLPNFVIKRDANNRLIVSVIDWNTARTLNALGYYDDKINVTTKEYLPPFYSDLNKTLYRYGPLTDFYAAAIAGLEALNEISPQQIVSFSSNEKALYQSINKFFEKLLDTIEVRFNKHDIKAPISKDRIVKIKKSLEEINASISTEYSNQPLIDTSSANNPIEEEPTFNNTPTNTDGISSEQLIKKYDLQSQCFSIAKKINFEEKEAEREKKGRRILTRRDEVHVEKRFVQRLAENADYSILFNEYEKNFPADIKAVAIKTLKTIGLKSAEQTANYHFNYTTNRNRLVLLEQHLESFPAVYKMLIKENIQAIQQELQKPMDRPLDDAQKYIRQTAEILEEAEWYLSYLMKNDSTRNDTQLNRLLLTTSLLNNSSWAFSKLAIKEKTQLSNQLAECHTLQKTFDEWHKKTFPTTIHLPAPSILIKVAKAIAESYDLNLPENYSDASRLYMNFVQNRTSFINNEKYQNITQTLITEELINNFSSKTLFSVPHGLNWFFIPSNLLDTIEQFIQRESKKTNSLAIMKNKFNHEMITYFHRHFFKESTYCEQFIFQLKKSSEEKGIIYSQLICQFFHAEESNLTPEKTAQYEEAIKLDILVKMLCQLMIRIIDDSSISASQTLAKLFLWNQFISYADTIIRNITNGTSNKAAKETLEEISLELTREINSSIALETSSFDYTTHEQTAYDNVLSLLDRSYSHLQSKYRNASLISQAFPMIENKNTDAIITLETSEQQAMFFYELMRYYAPQLVTEHSNKMNAPIAEKEMIYHRVEHIFSLVNTLTDINLKTELYNNHAFVQLVLKYRSEKENERQEEVNEKKSTKLKFIAFIAYNLRDSHVLSSPCPMKICYDLYGPDRTLNTDISKINTWLRETILHNNPLFHLGQGSETAQVLIRLPEALLKKFLAGTDITVNEIWESAYPNQTLSAIEREYMRYNALREDIGDIALSASEKSTITEKFNTQFSRLNSESRESSIWDENISGSQLWGKLERNDSSLYPYLSEDRYYDFVRYFIHPIEPRERDTFYRDNYLKSKNRNDVHYCKEVYFHGKSYAWEPLPSKETSKHKIVTDKLINICTITLNHLTRYAHEDGYTAKEILFLATGLRYALTKENHPIFTGATNRSSAYPHINPWSQEEKEKLRDTLPKLLHKLITTNNAVPEEATNSQVLTNLQASQQKTTTIIGAIFKCISNTPPLLEAYVNYLLTPIASKNAKESHFPIIHIQECQLLVNNFERTYSFANTEEKKQHFFNAIIPALIQDIIKFIKSTQTKLETINKTTYCTGLFSTINHKIKREKYGALDQEIQKKLNSYSPYLSKNHANHDFTVYHAKLIQLKNDLKPKMELTNKEKEQARIDNRNRRLAQYEPIIASQSSSSFFGGISATISKAFSSNPAPLVGKPNTK